MTEQEKNITLTLARKTDILLWVLSVPLIPMILAELFTVLSGELRAYFEVYYALLWVVFVLEFVLRISLEKDKKEYMKANWFDVLVVLTPMFKILKIFSFMRFPVMLFSDRMLSALASLGFNFLYYLVFVVVVVLAGANITLYFENQSQTSEIRTFDDAAWWAINALSTSGASQAQPVTFGGKTIAVLLMTIGFAIFSILVASVMSFFMKEYGKGGPNNKDLLEGIKDQLGLDGVVSRLERIEKKLDQNNHG